jgi:hypothetical protein
MYLSDHEQRRNPPRALRISLSPPCLPLLLIVFARQRQGAFSFVGEFALDPGEEVLG